MFGNNIDRHSDIMCMCQSVLGQGGTSLRAARTLPNASLGKCSAHCPLPPL